MELRQLRYFLAVADELNFTRAARRVGIAQPPLSQQIKALETDLGAQLFVRTRRKVHLTGAGQELVGHARSLLQSAENARLAVLAAGEGLRGTISIAAIYTAAYTIVPRILQKFRDSYPLISVQLQEMSIADQHKALNNGAIDAGLLRPPTADARLDYVPLFEEPFVAVIPARHKLRTKRSLSLIDIAKEPFVSLPRLYQDSVGAVVASMFASHHLHPEIVQEVAEMHTLICLVASGLGVSVVPESLSEIRLRGVIYKPIRDTTSMTPVCLATSRETTSPVVRHFVKSVIAEFRPHHSRRKPITDCQA